MILDTLITDRTGGDVSRLKALIAKGANMTQAEIEQFLLDSKGAYNASDLNRVGEACEYIASELQGVGEVFDIEMKKDWSMSDRVTATQLREYLASIKRVHDAVSIPITPAPNKLNNIREANAIEQMLLDIHDIIQRQLAFLLYSGEIFSGEV